MLNRLEDGRIKENLYPKIDRLPSIILPLFLYLFLRRFKIKNLE